MRHECMQVYVCGCECICVCADVCLCVLCIYMYMCGMVGGCRGEFGVRGQWGFRYSWNHSERCMCWAFEYQNSRVNCESKAWIKWGWLWYNENKPRKQATYCNSLQRPHHLAQNISWMCDVQGISSQLHKSHQSVRACLRSIESQISHDQHPKM